MKKKQQSPEIEAGVDEELLRKAKLAVAEERVHPAEKCVICGSEAAPNSPDVLCWVCRRLKISAWRDNDGQIAAQE
ncbi:MAG TPA: hypothetical protein VES20_22340 [Bryobacteraceae bacterium]|nr:hypothetical protein [Bryobacteraceae bacterium]